MVTRQMFEESIRHAHEGESLSETYLDNAILRGWNAFQHLPHGQGQARLLDVGGMNGLFAAAYLDLFGYAEVAVIGDDAPASGHVDIVRKTSVYSMEARQCDIETERWPFPDHSFDTVVCTEVLEHMLFDPMAAANEMCRVLKPGGQLLVTVPNTCSDECLIWLVNDMQPTSLGYYNVTAVQRGKKDLEAIANMGHFHEYTRTDLECLLKAAGFELEFLSSFSARGIAMDGFKFRLLLRIVRFLFPHAKRMPGCNLIALAKKQAYLPLEERPVRYPPPLYKVIH